MKFCLKADVVFEAEDLDDAFWLLHCHFHDVAMHNDSKLFDPPSHIELKSVEDAQ